MIHWGGCFSFLTFFTVQEHQRIHSYLISKYIFYPSEDVKKKCVPFCVCTLNKYWNGEMNLGCFLHKRLEDYGNLNPVDFFLTERVCRGSLFSQWGKNLYNLCHSILSLHPPHNLKATFCTLIKCMFKKTVQNRLYFGRTTKSTLQHHSNLTTLQYCCDSAIKLKM